MMIYAIRLPKRKDEKEFEKFMTDEIFPAIDKGQRRDGRITGLELLKGNNTGHTNEYLWMVYGGVNGGAARQQVEKIEAFGARVKPMLDFERCASWFADGAGRDQKKPK